MAAAAQVGDRGEQAQAQAQRQWEIGQGVGRCGAAAKA